MSFARSRSALLALGAFFSACEPDTAALDAPFVPQGKISLGVIHSWPGAQEDEEARALRLTGARYEVTLKTLSLVISDVELHACIKPDLETSSRHAPWSMIAEAHAHVPDSASRLGTPTIEDLLGAPGRARMLGEVAPPPGRYCGLRVVIAPADEDVVNLSEAPSRDVLGRSAVVHGEVRALGGSALDVEAMALPMALKSEQAWSWEVKFEEPIVIDAQHRSAFVLIEKALTGAQADQLGAWAFEQVGGEAPRRGEQELARRWLELVGGSLRRYKPAAAHRGAKPPMPPAAAP